MIPPMWQEELNDLARGFAGAFLFGVPLLYTQEMWWIATYINIWKLLVFLLVAVVANVLLGRIARRRRNLSWGRTLAEVAENLAIGMLAALVALLVLGRISLTDPILRILSAILLLTVPLSLGAAVTHSTRKAEDGQGARGQGARGKGDSSGGQGNAGAARGRGGVWQRLLHELSLTAAGAMILAFTLAPILEIPVLAATLDFWHELILVAFSILIAYGIVYKSGLQPERETEQRDLLWPLTDTLMAYAVALVVAALSLYLFDRITLGGNLDHTLSQIVVMGLPAAVGGAAGRKVI